MPLQPLAAGRARVELGSIGRAPALAAAAALALTAACGGGASGGGAGQTPSAVELSPFAVQADGSPADIAADDDTVWIASGRRLAVLDAATLERLPQLESDYPRTLCAVELDPAGGDLLIADEGALYRRSPASGPEELLWTVPPSDKLQDVALAPGRALVLSTRSVYVLQLGGDGAALAHAVDLKPGDRGSALRTYTTADGGVRAAIVVHTKAAERLINGLVLLTLPEGDAPPVLSKTWMPPASSPQASVEAVLVLPGPGGTDQAWVAAGLRGAGGDTGPYLELLDVTDTDEPRHLEWVELAGAAAESASHQLAADQDGGRVFVTTDGGLFTVDADSLSTLGSLPATFGMDRSAPLLQPYPLGLRLWSIERQALEHNFRIFDVTQDQPELFEAGWWWCSSDAAVHAPEWRSIYLTTFGGVVRYDVTDPAHPVLVGGHFPSAGGTSYAPATEITEDADLLSAGAASRLLVARGAGGFDAFPVSAAAPDPGPPTTVPTSLEDFTYNNAVAAWTSPTGVRYALTDATTAAPGGPRYFLEAARYDPADGGFDWVATTVPVVPPAEIEMPLTSNLAVAGRFAFVGARGMFFVVDLGELPHALPIADLVTVVHLGEANVFVRGIAPGGDHLYVCIRGDGPLGSVFAVYGFDQATGDVTELPLATVKQGDPGVPGDFALYDRAHMGPGGKTVLACGALGHLLAFDVEDPLKPYLAGEWQDPGGGLTSDCRVETFTFPGGEERELVMFVTMAETFKLIAIE